MIHFVEKCVASERKPGTKTPTPGRRIPSRKRRTKMHHRENLRDKSKVAMLGRVVEKTWNGRRLIPAAVRLSMPTRTRENLAILLFFPALAWLILNGWDNFGAETGWRAWLHLLIPAGLMTLGLIVWPGRPPDVD
jgi:hypothetical protein